MLSIGMVFWILMIIALVFGLWSNRENLWASGFPLFLWVLLFLLGWATFGFPISGSK